MASGSTQDISLLFGVDVGNDGSGSMKLIMDQLNSIVATINANPFKLKFEVDPASLNLIKSQIQEIHNLTGVKSFNSFNEMNDILGISASLDQIRDSSRQVAQVLSSMFVGVDGGASLFESHLERIRSLLDEINGKRLEVYSGGGLTYSESEGLKNISVNIDSAVKGLVEFKQILTEILSVIQQINAKDFNITNQFSVSKMDNQRKEVALYKNELIELFKVNEQLLGTLGTISNGSGFSTIKSALDATGNSNIYELLTTLDRLKISIDSIKGIKSIAGLDTVKSQLMDLYNSLTAVFEKINTSGSMKVLLPDTSALQKASSDLAAFTSQQDKYNESVQRSVAQAVGANVPGITPNITGMSEQLSKITSETQTALNSIRAQIEKTFDLSTININSEALVAKLTNILTNISPLEQSLKQIGAQLSGALTINNAQFDTTKISESITKIKTEFETFKSDVVSDMQEIKIAIEEGFTGEGIKTYLGNLNTVVQSQKEVVSTAQAISSIVVANAEQAKSESQLAAETKKSAEAQERSAKASKKTSVIKQEAAVTEKRLFDAYRATHEILRKNAESINLDIYDKLIGKLSILNTVMDKVRYENMSVMQAFKSLKYSGKEFMESLNTDISELKLNIETMGKDGTISLSNLYTTMRKMNKVVYSGMETKNLNPEIYNTLSERFKLFNQVAEISKNELISVNEAFIKLGYSANEVMTSTNELLSKFNLEMSGVTSSDKVYSQLYSSINVLNSASKLDGTTEFNNLNSQITLIKEALKLVDQEGINVEEAFNRLGTTAKQTLESTKIASYALKISMSENKEEVTKTSEELMSLSKAYNALNKAQRLIVKNPTYKDTQEYKSLSESVATLTLAIEAAESGTMSLNAAFNLLGVDGKNLFESIDVSAAKLNNTLMSADSTSLTQAYNKLSQIEGLINSNSGKSIKGSDEYNNLATSMTLLSNAIKIAEENSISISQAFNQMGYNGKEAINNIDLSIVKFNRSISGIDVTSLTSAYSALLKYETLLSSNTNIKDNESYTKLSWDTNTLREAISLAEQQSISLGSAFNQMGVNCQETFDRMELSALRLKEAMVNTGVSGSISISDLNLKLSEMQKLLNKSDGNNSIDKSSQSFINLRNHIDLTRQALDLINNGGMSVEDALSSLGTNGSKYMSDVKAVTSEFKVTLTDAEQSARNLAASNKAAANSAKEAAKAEKERQTLLNKSYSLISRMQSASSKWTAAQNGKTSIEYSSITKNLSELKSLTSQYENGAITTEVFGDKLKELQNEFRASSEVIKQAGENTKSFSDRMGNIVQRFGAWFGITRIIMYVIRSIREMISASIELDDAFTQLQIVTRNSESTFENFGDTVSEVAKRTAVSMTDIVSSATTYARLGYDLETATKIAEYTAKLQNVGDIGVEDAQNAITAILKAYDDIDADHIEDVMNKLVVTGNNFPISVSQIAEGMNNASSALAAAGNTFEQSVALLTAANTTIELCRIA